MIEAPLREITLMNVTLKSSSIRCGGCASNVRSVLSKSDGIRSVQVDWETEAVAVTTRCEGCIDAHARKAKAAGATKEEIAEALGVAIALNAGAALTYSLHVLDAVDGTEERRA